MQMSSNRLKMQKSSGILVGDVSFDYGKMVDRKDRVITKIRKGVEGLVTSNNITLIRDGLPIYLLEKLR